MIELESPEAVLFDFDGTLAPNLDLADMSSAECGASVALVQDYRSELERSEAKRN